MALKRQRQSLCHQFCFTDIFCGFHSPEGLDGAARWVSETNLGLPQRENFVLLFLATFPVDNWPRSSKYWDFRYLNRVCLFVPPCAT